jgi:complement component 1 Q subcomponent-binding protein, mitochondrial
LDLLTREHAEEVQNSSEQDASNNQSELQKLHDELVTNQGWKIVVNGAMTRMMKTVVNATAPSNNKRLKIQVSFHCQDMVVPADGGADAEEYVEGQDAAQQEEEEEEQEEAASPVRFTVTISNPSSGVGTMVATCLSENAALNIQSVTMTTSSSSSSSSDSVDHQDGPVAVPDSDYQGPEFTELAQDLQDAFYTYFDETCGINDDVVAFVAMQADFMEQSCYVQFLNDASRLLK